MMRRGLMFTAALAGLMLACAGAGTASAGGRSDGEREAAVAAKMKVSLTQAIAVAEQHTGGKAYDAGVDANGGNGRFVVETNGPKGVQTVMIDGTSGQVVGGHAGGEAD